MPMPLGGITGCAPTVPPPGLEGYGYADVPNPSCPPGNLLSFMQEYHSFGKEDAKNAWAQPWRIEIDRAGSTHVRPMSDSQPNGSPKLENSDYPDLHVERYFMPPGLLESKTDSLDPYHRQEIISTPSNFNSERESFDDEDSQISFVDHYQQRKDVNFGEALQRDTWGWPATPPGFFTSKVDVSTSDGALCDSDQTCSQPCQQPTETGDNKWHSSALSVGDLYQDGHVFVKTEVGPKKNHAHGVVLSSLCMIFERRLALGGLHTYSYSIIGGSVGNADGCGFVLDTKIRRNNIQRVRSVFLNKHGQICLRNLDKITKLPSCLPKLTVGSNITLRVDLDRATATFKMEDQFQNCTGFADVSFADLVKDIGIEGNAPVAGFFCAVLTGNTTVSIY